MNPAIIVGVAAPPVEVDGAGTLMDTLVPIASCAKPASSVAALVWTACTAAMTSVPRYEYQEYEGKVRGGAVASDGRSTVPVIGRSWAGSARRESMTDAGRPSRRS